MALLTSCPPKLTRASKCQYLMCTDSSPGCSLSDAAPMSSLGSGPGKWPEKPGKTAQVLCPLHQCVRPGRSCGLLASVWPGPVTLGKEAAIARALPL